MFSAFQSNAFQRSSFQINGTSSNSADTHDGGIKEQRAYRKKLQSLANARAEFEESKQVKALKNIRVEVKLPAEYKENTYDEELAIILLMM